MTDLDAILGEIREIADRLLATPEGTDEWRRLTARRDVLRAEAAAVGRSSLPQRSTEWLETELAELRSRLRRLDRQRLKNPPHFRERSFADPLAWSRTINRELGEATAAERAAIERRIAELEHELEDRRR